MDSSFTGQRLVAVAAADAFTVALCLTFISLFIPGQRSEESSLSPPIPLVYVLQKEPPLGDKLRIGFVIRR